MPHTTVLSVLDGMRLESSYRNFIRFYKFPLENDKPNSRARIWVSRIDREMTHMNFKSMRICSDHFCDDDFVQTAFYRTKIQDPEHWKSMKIPLKPDAIPNTIRDTGERRTPRPASAVSNTSSINTPVLKVKRTGVKRRLTITNSIEHIDNLLNVNESLIDKNDQAIMSLRTPSSSTSSAPTTPVSLSLDVVGPSILDQIQETALTKTRVKSVHVQTECFRCSNCCNNNNVRDIKENESVMQSSGSEDEIVLDRDVIDTGSGADYSFLPTNSAHNQSALSVNKIFTSQKRNINKITPVKSVIVDVEMLLKLFKYCLHCSSPVESIKTNYSGSAIAVECMCLMGHSFVWRSGDMQHRIALLNVRLSAAATLSGLGYSTFETFFKLLEIPPLSKPAFYKLAKTWLYPVIVRDYDLMRTKTIEDLKKCDELNICGDAQYDSPGYSAKFCTYTLMQCGTDRIVDFLPIQKGQYEGELERNACEEILKMVTEEDQLNITNFVTDAHIGIGKLMRDNYPSVQHSYDIWHFGKSLRKKFKKASKKNPKIASWENSLVNHFWWSAQNCNGNPELLMELFHASLFHVLNIHAWGNRRKIHQQFKTLKGTKPYPKPPTLDKLNQKCLHQTLTKGASRKGMWFKIGDSDFEALFKVITNTRMCNSMKKCAQFLHTGALEALHCAKLKYLPKRKAFSMDSTIVLMMLVCIEHNKNLRLGTALKPKTKVAYSRAQKQYVLKNNYFRDNISYKKSFLELVQNHVKSNTKLTFDLGRYKRKDVPKRFHSAEKPSKALLEQKRLSRMGK